MRICKGKLNQVKTANIHYNRLKPIDDEIRGTSYSKINPTKSHLNYNLHNGKMTKNIKKALKSIYKRNSDTIAYTDLCITYPKDCNVSEKEFFTSVYNILKTIKGFETCVGAFVHLDESSPHMHYISCPIEYGEITKIHRIKVYDEKKEREVNRNKTVTYKGKLNAKGLINKALLNNLHPLMQYLLNKQGIKCTIITKERERFNQWKLERINHYNKLIQSDPKHRADYIDQYWQEYQRMNPKEYKKKAKDARIDQFTEMFEEAVKDCEIQLQQINAKKKEQAEELENLDAVNMQISAEWDRQEAEWQNLNDVDNRISKRKKQQAQEWEQLEKNEKFLEEMRLEQQERGLDDILAGFREECETDKINYQNQQIVNILAQVCPDILNQIKTDLQTELYR